MVGPGSALRSVHPSLPVVSMILVVTSVLTSLDATPPWDLSDPMIRLRPPPRSPLPGSGPGCNETVWFPSADPAKTWRFPCHWPRCTGRRLSNRRCCSARDSASNQGNVFSALWVSRRFSHPRNRNRVLAVAQDLRRRFAERDLAESPTASSC